MPVDKNIARRLKTILDLGAPSPAAIPTADKQPHSAGHSEWLSRRTGKMTGAIPTQWRDAIDLSGDPAHVAVVMHVFFTDLVAELTAELRAIPVPFDLFVTNASGTELTSIGRDLPLLGRLTILDVDNHGRDILPMVRVVNSGLLDPYQLVLKVHTKKSTWRAEHADLQGSGEAWRRSLLGDLLGSEDNVRGILAEFADNPRLGLVTADGSLLGPDFWGDNERLTAELLRRLELDLIRESLRFAAGSMYWIRGFILQGLRALELNTQDFDPEQGQSNATTAHAVERLIGIVTEEAGYSLSERSELCRPDSHPYPSDGWRAFDRDAVAVARARVIPFYLPQFHAFEENERWWGRGFTEWSNVSSAVPVFAGHNQPRLPADLGFYDLRDQTVRPRQYELARRSGIEGFMYYYYWFAGTTLMDLPLRNHVADDGNEPFCIMWANENWTRAWDGGANDVLIAQDYGSVPAAQFIHDVLPYLTDPRYITVEGKPILAVYRVGQLPNPADTIAHWRQEAAKAGLPGLHIVSVDVGKAMEGVDDIDTVGMDAWLEFAPHNKRWAAMEPGTLATDPRFTGAVFRYDEMVSADSLRLAKPVEENRYPGVMVGFDNTARRQWNPHLWWGSNPYTFRRWLDATISAVADRGPDKRLVFVNAWNEWAEAAVLEPTQRFGATYLLAVRDAVLRYVHDAVLK